MSASYIDMATKSTSVDNVTQVHIIAEETRVINNSLVVTVNPTKFNVLHNIWIESDADVVLEEACFKANGLTIERISSECIQLWREFMNVPKNTIPFGFTRKHGFPVFACKYIKITIHLTFNKSPENVRVGLHGTIVHEDKYDKSTPFEIEYPILSQKTVPIKDGFFEAHHISGKIGALFFATDDGSVPDTLTCLFEMPCRFALSGEALSKILPIMHNSDHVSDRAMMYPFCKDVKNLSSTECTDFDKVFCSFIIKGTMATSVNITALKLLKIKFAHGSCGFSDI